MDCLLSCLLIEEEEVRVTQEVSLPPKDGSCEEARSPLLDTPAVGGSDS